MTSSLPGKSGCRTSDDHLPSRAILAEARFRPVPPGLGPSVIAFRPAADKGPCRFTDLKNGLPGIAANLLSIRLKELEDAGLISREDAPPPVATVLYALTENGLALEPVLKALGL